MKKTNAARRQGVVVCCIPGHGGLDLKHVARLTGNKNLLKRSLPLLVTLGAVVHPTWLDSSALTHDRIVVSAGIRGAQLKLAPPGSCYCIKGYR